MLDIKQRELRDSGSIANTNICFEVRATALRPRLHTEGFSLIVHIGLPTQGTSTENLGNTTLEYTTPLSNYNNLYTRGKALSQSKGKGLQHLVSQRPQTNSFSQKQDPNR